eukprot:2314342-Pleurochrysis_carterae.AAC.1
MRGWVCRRKARVLGDGCGDGFGGGAGGAGGGGVGCGGYRGGAGGVVECIHGTGRRRRSMSVGNCAHVGG